MFYINIQTEDGLIEACVSSVNLSKCSNGTIATIPCHDAYAGKKLAMAINKAMYQQTINSLTIPEDNLVYISRVDNDDLEEKWNID